MNAKDWFKFLGEILPVVGNFIEWLVGLTDKQWEQISETWPEPTKTEIAWVRSEAKARKHFYGED